MVERASWRRGTARLGLRALGRLGGLPVLARPGVRSRVSRLLGGASTGVVDLALVTNRRFANAPGPGAQRPVQLPPSRPLGFDLTPTPDQVELTRAARDFADEVLRPAGRAADDARATPETLRYAAADLGLHLLGVPVEHGGIAEGPAAVTTCLVLEELARGDLGLAAALLAPGAVATVLAAYGSGGHQAAYLPALLGPEPAPAALALQEPQPLFDALAPRTTARTDGGDLVLTGTKAMVPLIDSAELFIVSAEHEGEPRLVLVESGTPGLRAEDDPAMGVRAARTGRLVLDGARVPYENLLGTTDDHALVVARSRLAWSAAAVGVGRAVLDQVIPYVKEREAFGEPIAHRQSVAFLIADLALELDGLRLVVWKAAARLDAGQDATALVGQARSLTARHGVAMGSAGVQLLGGHGFVKEWDNERWYRDLRGTGLLEGGILA